MHVSLEAITAIHLDWAGGAPLPGFSIPAEQVRKFDLAPREITAALIGLKNRADVFRVQRQIHGYRGEALMAVMPGVALLAALLAAPPLERQGCEVTEFLIVPYFGACIHTPPPVNQIIHANFHAAQAAPRGMKTPAPLRPPPGGFQFARCARYFGGSP